VRPPIQFQLSRPCCPRPQARRRLRRPRLSLHCEKARYHLYRCDIRGAFDLDQVISPLLPTLGYGVPIPWAAACHEHHVVEIRNVIFQLSVWHCRTVQCCIYGAAEYGVCEFGGDTRFIDTHFGAGANFTGCNFREKPFFRVARAYQASASIIQRSTREPNCPAPRLTTYRFRPSRTGGESDTVSAQVTGTSNSMATLQRTRNRWQRTGALPRTNGCLVISSGIDITQEYTDPLGGTLNTNVYLKNATVDRLELYNVHFAKALDLLKAILRSKELMARLSLMLSGMACTNRVLFLLYKLLERRCRVRCATA